MPRNGCPGKWTFSRAKKIFDLGASIGARRSKVASLGHVDNSGPDRGSRAAAETYRKRKLTFRLFYNHLVSSIYILIIRGDCHFGSLGFFGVFWRFLALFLFFWDFFCFFALI